MLRKIHILLCIKILKSFINFIYNFYIRPTGSGATGAFERSFFLYKKNKYLYFLLKSVKNSWV